MVSSPLPSTFRHRDMVASPATSIPSMDDSSSADEKYPTFNQMLRSSSTPSTAKKTFKLKKDDSESSREIRREYKKEWYEKNREKALAKMKEYYEKRKQAGTLHRRCVKQKKVAQQPTTATVAPVVRSLPSMVQLQHRHASMTVAGLMPPPPSSRYVHEDRCIPQITLPSPWASDRPLPSLSEQTRRPHFLNHNHHQHHHLSTPACPAAPTTAVAHLNLLCEVALMN
ncbi:hypothetical protein DYB32_000060 [Aphanomyces invadans]|nr:hypothetical protein DYB32_000060 [Aphanomyces invadans]